MKRLLYILFLLFLLAACRENKKEQFARLVQEWQGKEIVFPQDMVFTRFVTEQVEYRIPDAEYKVLIYVDSTGCTSCKLQLPKWKELIAHVDSTTNSNIPFIFVFQSKDDKELRYILKRDNFARPVCIDRDSRLDKLNKFPQDITFQTFLLDQDNKVKVIGNPVHNLAVRDLYLKTDCWCATQRDIGKNHPRTGKERIRFRNSQRRNNQEADDRSPEYRNNCL